MTTNSGINPQLLTVTGLGYNGATTGKLNTYAGMFFFDQATLALGMSVDVCDPAGDTSCLLPTYYNKADDPYNAQSSSSGTPTGFFDYNQGQLITNQQGDSNDPNDGTDTSYWVNEWPNWAANWTEQGDVGAAGVVPIIDTDIGWYISYDGLPFSAFSAMGRPVLFDRTQVATTGTGNSDCFYWNGATSSPADGTGCLVKRTTSSQILPAVPSNW